MWAKHKPSALFTIHPLQNVLTFHCENSLLQNTMFKNLFLFDPPDFLQTITPVILSLQSYSQCLGQLLLPEDLTLARFEWKFVF